MRLWLISMLLPSLVLARPGNPERYPVGADATGMGGAAIAHAKSAWFNPAGLGTVEEQGLSASLSAYGYTSERIPKFVDALDPSGVGILGEVTNSSVDIFPASIEYVKPLGELGPMKHGIGVSVVVPDYDQFDGVLSVPSRELLFEIRARRLTESQTYWVMPAWGGCIDKLCFGAGPAAAVFLQDVVMITTMFTEYENGDTLDVSESYQSRVIAAMLGAQLGVQYELIESLRLGLTVRTPMSTIAKTGEFLNVFSYVDSANPSYLDRVEVQDPYIDRRMPWRFGLGVSYARPESFSVALDVRMSLGLDDYVTLAGPNQESTLPPTFPGGQVDDPNRAVFVERGTAQDLTINVNLGGQLQVSEGIALQAGSFTDFSATSDTSVLTYGDDQLSRIGATLGVAWIADPATTWVSLLFAYGWGQVAGLGGLDFTTQHADLTSWTFLLMLGSSATL